MLHLGQIHPRGILEPVMDIPRGRFAVSGLEEYNRTNASNPPDFHFVVAAAVDGLFSCDPVSLRAQIECGDSRSRN
jgi:hypothetical protein